MRPLNQALEVWGPLACFTRPDVGKVERFSYPLITPSAARGIFDAIYCKRNSFCWRIRRIEVLSLPSYLPLRRNEVKEKANLNAVFKWIAGKAEPEPIWADGDKALTGSDQKGRTQRQTMALKNVRYRIHALIQPWPGQEGRLQAAENQFRRRAANGKCIYQPYLGCREFPAFFELLPPEADPAETVRWSADLGLMLYDVFDLSRPGDENSPPAISLFRAKVENGILDIPDYAGDQVYKLEGGGHA